MKYLLFILLPLITGCVTTSKVNMFCNKTIDLDQRPLEGKVDVGIRIEFFRDWSKIR